MTRFGKLERVDLYEAWPHEAHDFTPWLAENLDRLGDAIGIPLELVDTEVKVGRFAADIVASNLANDSLVVIENQLRGSDHKHFGQIMTYLAGVEAQTVVWVARGFYPSHLAAVRWINENTKESFAFLAVRLRVVRIADSPMVPIFKVVESPNEWDRKTTEWDRKMRETVEPVMSGLAQFRQDFWAHYRERHPGDGVSRGLAAPAFWVWMESAELNLAPYVARHSVGVWVRGRQKESLEVAKDRVRPWSGRLREELGVTIGEGRSWGACAGSHYGIDTHNRDNWPEAADWLHNKIADYRRVFEGPRDEKTDAPSEESPE